MVSIDDIRQVKTHSVTQSDVASSHEVVFTDDSVFRFSYRHEDGRILELGGTGVPFRITKEGAVVVHPVEDGSE